MKPRWPPMEDQFWTSVSVSYAGLYAGFSLLRDFLLFSEEFSFKIHRKCFFKRQKRVSEFQIFLYKVKPSYRLYILTKISHQTNEKPNKTASKNYFRKLLSARPLFTVSLPPSDNLVHVLGHTATMNLFKYSVM